MLRPEILLVVGNGEFTGHFALLYHPFLLLEDPDLLSLIIHDKLRNRSQFAHLDYDDKQSNMCFYWDYVTNSLLLRTYKTLE